MAKKKPVAQNLSDADIQNISADSSGKTDTSAATEIEAKTGIVKLSLSDEVRQKLDAYEKVSAENANYAQQVSDLQDRIAGYIGEIAELKKQLKAKGDTLKAAPPRDPRDARLEEENARLKAEIAALKA